MRVSDFDLAEGFLPDGKDGFPRSAPFRSPEELEKYFSDTKVQCLICGRWYHALPVHLATHGVSAEDYKRRYRIPLNRGLVGRQVRAAMSKAVRKRIVDGEFDEHFKRISAMASQASALGHSKRKRLAETNALGVSRRKTADIKQVDKYINLIRRGALVGEALEVTGLRHDLLQTIFNRYPDLAALHREARKQGETARVEEVKRRQAEGRKRNKPVYEKSLRVLLTRELLVGLDAFRNSFDPPISQSEAARTLMEKSLIEHGYCVES